ncbi:MAG: tail fiber domain-containing protein [Gammaproteobacteria bacterium]
MAQHDQVIANQSASAVRADINSALAALFSNSSGAAAPTTTIGYQFWADTSAGIMKMRNGANNGWINLYTLDGITDYLGDANFYTTIVSSVPRLQFDTNDFISYDRSTNTYSFNVGSTSYASVDGNGLFTSQVRVADTSYGYALNADATSSYLSFASNDYFAFNRSTNTLQFLVGGATLFSLADGFGSIDSAGGAGGRLKSSNSANSMRLGFASPYPTIAVDNTVYQIASPSDIKLKQNIEDLSLDDAWQQVQAMRPVSFEWIQGPSGRQPGVIAQEMEAINPGFVLPPTEGFDPQEQVMQLNTSAIIATLTAALQQAMARIEALEQQAA